LLLKGHDEVARAALPIEACEMALLRVIHASSLPDPGELAKQIASGHVPVSPVGSPAPQASGDAAPVEAAEPSLPGNMAELVALLESKGRLTLAHEIHHGFRPIRFEPPEIEFASDRPVEPETLRDLAGELKAITGRGWKISIGMDASAPTLREQKAASEAAERESVLRSPVVAAAIEAFPDAELIGWTRNRSVG